MNILNTQHMQATGKGGTPSTDVLDMLGNNLQLDQASLKLLQENGKLEGMGFDQLLQMSEENPEALEQLISKAQGEHFAELEKLSKSAQLPEMPVEKNVLNSKAGLHPSLMSSEPADAQASHVLQVGKSEHRTTAVTNQKGSEELSNLLKLNNTKPDAASNANTNAQVMTSKQAQSLNANQATLAKEMQANNEAAKTVVNEGMNKTVKGQTSGDLVNLNQFMARQTKDVQKRAIAQNAYKPMTKSMFNQKVEASLPNVTTVKPETMSLQDVMLSGGEQGAQSSLEQGFAQQPQLMKTASNISTVNTANNVFDINSLQGTNTTDEVITKIQDYIVQSKVSRQQEVKMSFDHQQLGRVDVAVEKAQNDALNISIGARSLEGSKFFAKNQGELLATLTQAGINVGEFKLDSSQNSSSSNQNSFENSSKQYGQNGNKEHGSERGQQQEDSRKREELWETVMNKEVA